MMCMLLLSNAICYLDRTNIRRVAPVSCDLFTPYILHSISVAILSMAADLGWSESQQGLVLSAFFWGYVMTQVLGGWCVQSDVSLVITHTCHCFHCNSCHAQAGGAVRRDGGAEHGCGHVVCVYAADAHGRRDILHYAACL